MEMDDSLFDLNIVCVDETGTWTIVSSPTLLGH